MSKIDGPEDPAAMIDEARQLRAQADEIEERAIRLAVEHVGWMEARAAQMAEPRAVGPVHRLTVRRPLMAARLSPMA
jgi:hypothetical protein